jgi:superfamily II DNA or RNA helicase
MVTGVTALSVTATRPIYLTREGSIFRLSFSYSVELHQLVKVLPHAAFDPTTKTWTTLVCAQSVDGLRQLFYRGLTDVSVDSLLASDEVLPTARAASLRAGTPRRPFYVHLAFREDNTYQKLSRLPGAQWEKKAQAVSFPASGAVALAELVARGVIDDPEKLLAPAAATVAFDSRIGKFTVLGDDKRAAVAFDQHFPASDVVASWKSRGLDVAFLEPFSEQMYHGELARNGPGLQPAGLLLDLFDYQKRTVAVAVTRTGLGVFHEPGLGKTACGIAAGLELLNRQTITRVVAVVPAAVRTQWRREITRFTGVAESDIVLVAGTPQQRAQAYADALSARWVIVHYDVLSRDAKKLKDVFNGALVIADEAHRAKTWTAARTKSLLELSRGAARRMALTGTPVEAAPDEWYQILSGFAVPGCLGNPIEFNDRYRYKARFGGYEGAKNLIELRERSRPFYIRSTKAEVATHLPPLRVQHLPLDPDPAYAAALRRAHREAAEEIRAAQEQRLAGRPTRLLLDADELEAAAGAAEMTAVGQLRLMCSSPRLVHQSTSAAAAALIAELKALQEQRKDRMAAAGVTEATAELVTGERMVVFTFSKRMADLISARFTEDGISHVTFTGATTSDARDAAVAAFTDPRSDVLAFVATDAAAEGLNLGRCCNLLINVDLAWTASKQTQRAQRIHRLDGTAPSYLVINMTVSGTMEHGVLRLIEQRADLSDALFGESGARQQTTGRHSGKISVFEEAMAEFTGPASPRPSAGAAARGSGKAPGKRRSSTTGDVGGGRGLPLPEEPPSDEDREGPPDEVPVDDGPGWQRARCYDAGGGQLPLL